MAKRIVVLFFFMLALAFWLDAGKWMSALAQRTRMSAPPREKKYSNFKHSSHAGAVKSLTQMKSSYDLDCAYCHGTAVKDRLGENLHGIEAAGFPNTKNAAPGERTHSACSDCHAFTGAKIERDMCTICHDKMDTNPRKMATNIKPFPDQELTPVSEFYDNYSHNNHVGYFESFATQTALKDRIKFFDAKGDAKANAKLDKNKFECSSCHTNNAAPQTVGKITFATGVKEKAPGHPECFICHLDPKIIEPPKPGKPSPKNTFATNCSGCHQETGKAFKDNRPVLGSEPAVLWFARQIINTEYNPKQEGVKAPLPYSHKTHDDSAVVGKSVKDCLSCHVTGKTANTRSDFYLEDRKTKEKQPLVTSCVDCHDKEMKTKIEGAVTLEKAKCNYCHSLQTVRVYSTMGIQLPPPNHFGGKPPKPTGPVLAKNDPKPTTAPTPQDVAQAKPAETPVKPAEEKPTPKPEEPKPTPAPAPVKAEDPKPAPPTPTPAPAPKESDVAAATPKESPAPPTPSPAPAPAAAAKPAGGGGGPEPLPSGKILLGDPKMYPKEWELQRGPTEFDHNSHLKPPYSKNCEECHHTNKDTRNEAVQKCWECHFQEGFESKGQSKVNLKDAYHGVEEPSNKAINAGCIECHKRYYEANPDKEKTGPTSKCAGCHLEKQSNLQIRERNHWLIDQWTALFRAYWIDAEPRIALATRRPR